MSTGLFRFRRFSLRHDRSSLKIGTDSVLLAAAVPLRRPVRILDVGCGCGVIGFCIADRLIANGETDFSVVGIDVDESSIQESMDNAEAFNHERAFQHFVFQQIALQDFTMKDFDLIVSNPPFFADSLKPSDAKRLQSKHRDENLPFAVLARKASELLADEGLFYLILPVAESEEFVKIAQTSLNLAEIVDVYPTPTKPTHRRILGFAKRKNEIHRSALTIRDASGGFTPEYIALTKQFYINMNSDQ